MVLLIIYIPRSIYLFLDKIWGWGLIPGIMERIFRDLEHLRSLLREHPPLEILEMIQNLWSRYSPSPSGICVHGIDSGYNYLEMRGYIIYVVDAIYVSSCGGSGGDARVGIIASEKDPEGYLSYISIDLEVSMAGDALKKTGYVVVDGSLVSKLGFLVRRAPHVVDEHEKEGVANTLKRIIDVSFRESPRVIYISKNSVSKDLVRIFFPKSYSALRTDLYYLDRYTIEPGYSKPIVLGADGGLGASSLIQGISRIYGSDLYIALSYVRLKTGGPIMRVEIPLRDPGDAEKSLLRIINAISGDASGYPLVLREADRLARISSKDMDRLKRILGLGSESQAWEAAKSP